MVHGLKQIIEPVPAIVQLSQEQLDELRQLGYEIDEPDLIP